MVLEAIVTALDKAGGETVGARSPIERVLIKFPGSRPDPRINVRVIKDLPEEVPVESEQRVVNEYLEIPAKISTRRT